MGLADDIKKQAKREASKPKKGKDAEHEASNILVDGAALNISTALNKLFYVTPDYDKEIEMIQLQKAQAQARGDRYGLHLSAIIVSEHEFCYREQVLSLFFKQCQGENIPIGLKRIFKEGEFIGEKWQRLFVSGGIGVKEHMDISRFMDKYDLSYTPDGRITLGGIDWVVETKSSNMFTYKDAKSHPSGRKQLRMYMFFERIKHGFVLMENKNDQNFKIFPEILGITFTKADIQPYIDRLEMVQEYKRQFIEEKTMVARHPECNTATCKKAQKCNMRDACFNVGMGRVKLNVR